MPAFPLPGDALGLHASREPECESEKLGLVEAMLARERYASILHIGCGSGDLGGLVADRCTSYTGMRAGVAAFADGPRRVPDGPSARFVPLVLPIELPDGEHELIVLSEVLQLLEPDAVRGLARSIAGHAPCREIVVIGARDETDGARDASLDALVAALEADFVHDELAVRRHYRIDALLRR